MGVSRVSPAENFSIYFALRDVLKCHIMQNIIAFKIHWFFKNIFLHFQNSTTFLLQIFYRIANHLHSYWDLLRYPQGLEELITRRSKTEIHKYEGRSLRTSQVFPKLGVSSAQNTTLNLKSKKSVSNLC